MQGNGPLALRIYHGVPQLFFDVVRATRLPLILLCGLASICVATFISACLWAAHRYGTPVIAFKIWVIGDEEMLASNISALDPRGGQAVHRQIVEHISTLPGPLQGIARHAGDVMVLVTLIGLALFSWWLYSFVRFIRSRARSVD